MSDRALFALHLADLLRRYAIPMAALGGLWVVVFFAAGAFQ
jgi:hypothetical protein